MRNKSDLLTLSGRMAECPDCGEQRLFLPVDRPDSGEFCCTGCDAGVYLTLTSDIGGPGELDRPGASGPAVAPGVSEETRRGVA